jgi:translation initiation factor 4G
VVPPSPNTDFTATASPARKSIVRIESQAEKEKRLEEEKARLAKEEQAKQEQAKVKEQAEREKEEKAKKAEEEKERLRLEAEQRKKDEEEKARKAKEEEERLRLESEQKKKEEERLKQEAEKKKAEEEAARKKKEEEEAHRQKEAERKEAEAAAAKEAEVKATNAAPPSKEPLEDGEVTEDASSKDAANATAKEGLRINTNSSMPPPTELPRRRPGPLDLSYTAKQPVAPPLPSALATARHIDDLGAVPYPDGVLSPKVELNANAQPGKYRYDRDFLLQFMSVCKEKPESLPPLDAIGIESSDQNFSLSRGGSGRHRTSSTAGPSRQNSVGLGSFGKQQFPTMGSFGTAPKTSEERFMASSNRSISVSGAGAVPPFGRPAMARTASQGGPSQLGTNRTRSRRGEKRGDGNKGPGVGQPSQLNPASNAGLMLEPVAPLEKSQNAWAPASVGRKPTAVDADSPAAVDRKVKSLLNKLTMEKFESISDQIIEWANRSEKEKDGRTLIQVIRLVFEKATDEATWSEMYARLCRKMMERISPEVKDDGIKNSEGKPIAGGNLFRKYLLNRCQEDFERGWAAKDAAASAAASKAASDKAIQESTAAKKTEGGEDEIALYSDEYYAAQKAKRRGLGLIKFIGELFKLQMLTERIMHECVQKLLRNVDNPEEEEIESLCKLLSTVGGMLDANTKARTHMDVYFTRMKELAKGSQVSSRMQFMLQDVVELRERKWVARNQVAAPATIAQVHEAAAKEKQAQEKESYNRTMSMSRGGSKRGMDRGEAGADGWTVQGGGAPPARPPSKAGDLSQFGKIGATKGTPMTFGPSSVFNKKDTKRESITRTGSSSNMFQMLQNAENAPEPSSLSKSSRPPSRKPSMDLGQAGVPEPATQRRKIILQPRTKPAEGTTTPQESRPPSPEEEPQAEMSEADAKRKLSEDLKEFKSVRNLDEAEDYFISLPHYHHALLVEQFVSFAVESKETDAQLVADLFARAVNKSLCSSSAFEEGFGLVSEFIGDVAIDAPKAPNYFALMVKASGLGDEERTRVAQKSADYGDKLTELFA